METIKRFLRHYFNFTKNERIGIYVLVFLIILSNFIPSFISSDEDYSEELKLFKAQIATLETANNPDLQNADHELSQNGQKPFYFDPNTIDPIKLKAFGLSDKLIERFTKYRNAGAKFYKKEDIKKIYGMKEDWYKAMFPYIQIKEKTFERNTRPNYSPKLNNPVSKTKVVEINSADSMDLVGIKGIGAFTSSKILKYRNILGGFYDLKQLYEIYNLKPEYIEVFINSLTLDTSKLTKLNVNTATYFQLKAHPYLNSKQANSIVKYREQHGAYKEYKDLEKIIVLKQDELLKLKPYLTF